MTEPQREPNTHRPKNQRQRGVVLIWVGMFLLVILAFMSLGADMAKLMTTHTQLQNSADAAALAGASAIDPTTGLIIPAVATTRAQLAATQNKAYKLNAEPVVVPAGDVEMLSNNRVKVTVRREGAESIVTHFAQVIGVDALQSKASAIARAMPVGTVPCGLVPLAVSPPPGGTFHTGCSGYTLKTAAGGGTGGNYGALDFPPCAVGACAGRPPTGASTFRCLIGNDYCCPITVGQPLTAEPGNMSSFRKGVQDRFARDTDQRGGICHSQYTGNGERIIMVPVTTPMPPGGRTGVVTVERFAAFFLQDIPGPGTNADLVGEFIYYAIPGSGTTEPIGAVAFTLRLVE